MEDSFQFIIESPQHNTGHKKRPRLVTSCDNCRLKKIKCLQPSPETKCEACKASKIPCRFRDRERYFAERSRAIAGPSAPQSAYPDDQRSSNTTSLDAFSVSSGSSSPAMSSHSNNRSASHSPKASGLVSAEVESNGRYQSYTPDPHRPQDPPHRHTASPSAAPLYPPRGNDPAGYGYNTQPPSQSQPRLPLYQSPSRHVHLFDPDHPQCPHPVLMPHYLQTFFERFGPEFPFFVYEDVMAEFWDRTLPPILANCIAAMASRFSNLPELTVRGLHNVAETYTDNAKTILSSVAHIPSMDTLHAIMLLSWSEYKNNRISGFRTYYQMAMRMAMDLGLSDQNAHQGHFGEKERNCRRATWNNILQMHMSAAPYER